MVEFREQTKSVCQIISLEAFSAVTVHSVSFALVRDGHTDLIGVEEPKLGAGETFLVVPVPGSTSKVSWFGVIEI